jgi:hypothetical protein
VERLILQLLVDAVIITTAMVMVMVTVTGMEIS